MALLSTAEISLSGQPDRLIMTVDGLDPRDARRMANQALLMARRSMPKMSGASAKRMSPVYGKGYFGVRFQDPYVWFQENGIKAFTMKSLKGKVVPMWVDDRDGKLRAKNPKIKVRIDAAGKLRVLIFRKATNPGAPGRINVREAANPDTRAGKVGGRIAAGNVGVKWRHPGLAPRQFLNNAVTLTAEKNGVLPVRLYAADARWRARA